VAVPTWFEPLSKVITSARSMVERGQPVFLIRLVTQPFPTFEEQGLLAKFGLPLLTVPDDAADPGISPEERNHILTTALQQYLQAHRQYNGEATLPQSVHKKPSRGRDLTDEERREFLDAVYGAGGASTAG